MTSWNPVTLLTKTARNSPWIVMAVALHLILLAAATIFYTSQRPHEVVDNGFDFKQARPREVDVPLEVPEEIVRREMPANKPVELTDLPPEWNPIPNATLEVPPGDPTSDDPPGLATSSSSIGVGKIGQRGPGVTAFTGRGPDLKTGKGPIGIGKNPRSQTDILVLNGLRWLARHQNEDGSWGALSLASRCDDAHKCIDTHKSFTSTYDEGLTGMALLAFLGAGFGHNSQEYFLDPARGNKKVVTGEVVTAGLKWLVAHENSDGSFGKNQAFMYNQALATMALCEAYGLTQARYWHDPAQRAVDYLEGAQRPSPSGQGLWGWRYASRQDLEHFHQGDSLDAAFKKELFDADTSVTGWAVMALKSARMSGLDVKQESFDGALAFVKSVSTADGQAGYLDAKTAGAKVSGPDDQFDYHSGGMSALAMCVRAFTAHDADDPFLEMAAKRVTGDLPRVSKDGLSVDYYYWYYGSLALNQFDGPESPRRSGKFWSPWNKAMVAAITEGQQKSATDCGEGGWLAPDRWCHAGGPVYATAINVLTLEVYYRYPNAFSAQRNRGVNAVQDKK